MNASDSAKVDVNECIQIEIDSQIPLTRPLCPAPPVAIRKATSEVLGPNPPVYISVGSTRASTQEKARMVAAATRSLLEVNILLFRVNFKGQKCSKGNKHHDRQWYLLYLSASSHDEHEMNASSYFEFSSSHVDRYNCPRR